MGSLAFVIVAALAAGYLVFLRRGNVSRADAHRLVANGAVLVDVRTPGEFAAGHLNGAINIPVDELDARLPQLGDKEQPIVVYCRSGARSRHAAGVLVGAGYPKVRNLGAMTRW